MANLLLDPHFKDAIERAQTSWRKVVALAAQHGVPAPTFATSLAYYDSYRSARVPQNLLSFSVPLQEAAAAGKGRASASTESVKTANQDDRARLSDTRSASRRRAALCIANIVNIRPPPVGGDPSWTEKVPIDISKVEKQQLTCQLAGVPLAEILNGSEVPTNAEAEHRPAARWLRSPVRPLAQQED